MDPVVQNCFLNTFVVKENASVDLADVRDVIAVVKGLESSTSTTSSVYVTINFRLVLMNETTYPFMLIPVTPLVFTVTTISLFTLLALLQGATTGFWGD